MELGHRLHLPEVIFEEMQLDRALGLGWVIGVGVSSVGFGEHAFGCAAGGQEQDHEKTLQEDV